MHYPTRRVQIWAACGIAVALLAASSTYLRNTDWWTERTIRRLIHDALAVSRLTGGRLSGIQYSPYTAGELVSPELDRASLDVLTLPPDSSSTIQLRAYLDILAHDWPNAAERLETLLEASPNDSGLTNDLGVVYLELAEEDPYYLAEALPLFQAAAREPSAVAPLFNLALAYKRLHLPREALDSERRFRDLARDPRWVEELDRPDGPTDLEALRAALADANIDLARAIVIRNPDTLWQVALGVGLNPSDTSSAPLTEVLRAMDRPEDRTLSAILDPLNSPERAQVIAVRRQILRAAAAASEGNFGKSVQISEGLRQRARSLASEFDRFWVDLIHANALIWTGNPTDLSEARDILESVIEGSRQVNLRWITAYGLTMYGSHPQLAVDRVELIQHLEEAIKTYEEIGALTESVRPRVLLALALVLEGSLRESFNQAHRALALTDPRDIRRRYPAHSAINRNPLFQSGSLALSYLKEAAEQASSGSLAAGEVEAYIALAEFYEASEQAALADQSLDRAERALERIQVPRERDVITLTFALGKARVLTSRRQAREAKRLLFDGLARLEDESVDVYYEQKYEVALGHAFSIDERIREAREHYRLAVAAVEHEDDQLDATGRLFFDQERRSVYETAIAFELDHESTAGALSFAQRYRAKLVRESMGPYRSQTATSTPVDFDRVNWNVLGTGIVLEYTLLEDRVVFSIFSRDGVEQRSLPIERDEFETEVKTYIELIATPSESPRVEELSRRLYSILIDPLRDLLDQTDSLAIIPDRVLHGLSFAALRKPDGRYLFETHLLTETLDLGYFLTSTAESTTGNLVAFAPPGSDAGMSREVTQLSRTLPRVVDSKGPTVNKASFLAGSKNAALLHYAGHSVFGANSRTSYLLLDANADPAGPNAVSAAEIAEMRLAPNALVVLSSCVSSIGNSIGGVEYRGLTSAFMAAGAGSVVGSLWLVETNATADLMNYFYRNLVAGESIAEALRQAQLTLMRQYPDPYYWSGFTVTGNRSALEAASFVTDDSFMAAAEPSR